ncbi:MAG TPA: PQQ-binding-like beta-propeller repeat protein [Gemmataceae bacterium]|nr:PQQ-binding-like beta-propeller repeat protein [Gemmataceae bacterium]
MRLLWSQTIPAPLRGLILAREREMILAWDGQDGLFLFNHAGTIQSQRPAPAPTAAAGCAEDGSAYAIAGSQTPMLCWLAPDLAPRWQRPLPQRGTALAMEPLGRRVAVADAGGTLHLMDARGRMLWQATTPRPLHHLAFVPETPILVGAADFGLVLCFGASGECLWRDGLVAHVGSLATSGDGSCVLLACFSDGLYRYSKSGPQQQRIPLDAPCHLAALSYAGDCLLTADRRQRVCLRDSKGDLRDQISLDAPAVSIALSALADYALVGLANGSVCRLAWNASDEPANPVSSAPG